MLYIYIYIYIYVCVCVCVCVSMLLLPNYEKVFCTVFFPNKGISPDIMVTIALLDLSTSFQRQRRDEEITKSPEKMKKSQTRGHRKIIPLTLLLCFTQSQ